MDNIEMELQNLDNKKKKQIDLLSAMNIRIIIEKNDNYPTQDYIYRTASYGESAAWNVFDYNQSDNNLTIQTKAILDYFKILLKIQELVDLKNQISF